MQKLDASAEKLNTILTRLVIVNHINHVNITIERATCEEVIEEILVLQRKRGIPTRVSVTYHVEDGLTMMTDRALLRVALGNLVENAVKFHSESDRVDSYVNVDARRKGTDRVQFTVTDNGIGIFENDQRKIFRMFSRASEKSETGGMGLYLAKISTEKMMGKISFHSEPRKVTSFTIELPVDLTAALKDATLDEHLHAPKQ